MKKWLIALTIIFGASLLTSASLAGKVYFKEASVYTDYDKQKLDLTNTKSIYINSDIPVEVKPTTGEAYVEFNQSFEDVLGEHPEFELKVEHKGNECYINLNQTKDVNIWVMVKKDEAMLTVYLPTQALDALQIIHQSYRNEYSWPQIDLTGIDVKNLDINQNSTNISLEGKYENIDISSGGSGNINISSKQKARVKLQGRANYNLEGLFDTVEIDGDGLIKMNTSEPTKVTINSFNSEIKLEGSYSMVTLLGNDNSINMKTNTLSDVSIEHYYGDITLDGPLNIVKVNGEGSTIDIQTTVNSKSIEVTGEQNSTTLRLPSNIPGFKIMRIASHMDDDTYQMDETGEYISTPKINSDFNITQQNKDTYTYGDSSLKMMVQIGEGLRILDNGYMIAK